jgi:Tfp pilus assembly protein FimT
MHRKWRQHDGADGFSIVELLIVCAIMMTFAAIALPSVFNVMSAAQASVTTGQLSSLFQSCRIDAVKQNRTKALHFTTDSGRSVAFTQNSAEDAAFASAERKLFLARGMVYVDSPSGDGAPTALDSTALWGSTSTLMVGDTSFNPRGLPCSFSGGACATGHGSVYYFRYTGLGSTRWLAISVSPAGRVKTWSWTGSKWGD